MFTKKFNCTIKELLKAVSWHQVLESFGHVRSGQNHDVPELPSFVVNISIQRYLAACVTVKHGRKNLRVGGAKNVRNNQSLAVNNAIECYSTGHGSLHTHSSGVKDFGLGFLIVHMSSGRTHVAAPTLVRAVGVPQGTASSALERIKPWRLKIWSLYLTVKGMTKEWSMNDIHGTVIFGTQSSVIDISSRFVAVIPLHVIRKHRPPLLEHMIQRITQHDPLRGILHVCG